MGNDEFVSMITLKLNIAMHCWFTDMPGLIFDLAKKCSIDKGKMSL